MIWTIASRHASRRASRGSSTQQTLLSFAQTLTTSEAGNPQGPRRVESNLEARAPMAANCSARLASELSPYCGDRRGYRRACKYAFFDHHYGPALASRHLATLLRRQDRGWLCNRCCTRGWFCVAQPDVALSDDRSRAADGTVERTERRRRRAFQACIRTCGGIFSGC
jgi:hypothetical protein